MATPKCSEPVRDSTRHPNLSLEPDQNIYETERGKHTEKRGEARASRVCGNDHLRTESKPHYPLVKMDGINGYAAKGWVSSALATNEWEEEEREKKNEMPAR